MIKESFDYLVVYKSFVNDFFNILRLYSYIKNACGIYGYQRAHLAEALTSAFGKQVVSLLSPEKR